MQNVCLEGIPAHIKKTPLQASNHKEKSLLMGIAFVSLIYYKRKRELKVVMTTDGTRPRKKREKGLVFESSQ